MVIEDSWAPRPSFLDTKRNSERVVEERGSSKDKSLRVAVDGIVGVVGILVEFLVRMMVSKREFRRSMFVSGVGRFIVG